MEKQSTGKVRRGNARMFQWINRKENVKYILCFRPLYGAAVGIAICLLQILCQRFEFGQTCFALVGAAIPVLMSGGIYLSGFMNTSETLAAGLYEKAGLHEKAGCKDKNAGAADGSATGTYRLIAAMTFYLLYAGGLAVIRGDRQLVFLGLGFVISRALHGMAFLWFPAAEKGKSTRADFSLVLKRTLRTILSIILALCFCTCIMIEPIMGMLEALLSMWIWTYYYYMSKKVFGGVTEESAGYFLVLCELATVLFVGMFGKAFL